MSHISPRDPRPSRWILHCSLYIQQYLINVFVQNDSGHSNRRADVFSLFVELALLSISLPELEESLSLSGCCSLLMDTTWEIKLSWLVFILIIVALDVQIENTLFPLGKMSINSPLLKLSSSSPNHLKSDSFGTITNNRSYGDKT